MYVYRYQHYLRCALSFVSTGKDMASACSKALASALKYAWEMNNSQGLAERVMCTCLIVNTDVRISQVRKYAFT
jgi:hypothetical protein